MANKSKEIAKKYADLVNIKLLNSVIEESGQLEDFELTKNTIQNISKWALDGKSDTEIRQNLELTNAQWGMLLTICPSLVIVMQHSRALADTMIAGSLFQTAIGGKKIKKQQPLRVRDYDETGKVIGEHYEIVEVEEELPPNPVLLKFLAEHKLSENFSDKKVDNSKEIKDVIENMSAEELALVEMAKGQLDGD